MNGKLKRVLSLTLSAALVATVAAPWMGSTASAARKQSRFGQQRSDSPYYTFFDAEHGHYEYKDDGQLKQVESVEFTKAELNDLHDQGTIFEAVPEEGYGFAGWYTDRNYTSEKFNYYSTSTLALGNFSFPYREYFCARFNPLVDVTFDAGDHGTVAAADATERYVSDYRFEKNITFPDVEVEDGYEITGWTNSVTGETVAPTWRGQASSAWADSGVTFTAQYDEVQEVPQKICTVEVTIGDALARENPNLTNGWKRNVLHAEYDRNYIFLSTNGRGGFETALVSRIPSTLTTAVDTVEEARDFFSGFTFMNTFFSKEWYGSDLIADVAVDGTTLRLTLDRVPAEQEYTFRYYFDGVLDTTYVESGSYAKDADFTTAALMEQLKADDILKDEILRGSSTYAFDRLEQDGTTVNLYYTLPTVRYIFNVVCDGETLDWSFASYPKGTVFTLDTLKSEGILQDPFYEYDTQTSYTFLDFEQDGTNIYLYYDKVIPTVRYIFNVVCDGETLDWSSASYPKGTVFTLDTLKSEGILQDPFYEYDTQTSYNFRDFEQDGTNIYLHYDKVIPTVRYIFNVVCDGETLDWSSASYPKGTVFTLDTLKSEGILQDPFYEYDTQTSYTFLDFEQDGTTVNLYYK